MGQCAVDQASMKLAPETPVQADQLQGDSMERLKASLEQGQTLPAQWYTDRNIYELEQQNIFGRSWQFVGLTEDVTRPGEFFTGRAANVPIVVVRDEDNTLRAFVNVCRHRGSRLVSEERGSRKSLQCRYHAWTYGLEGQLIAAPGSNLEPNFHKGDYRLFPVTLDTWGPFIFVNPRRQDSSLRAVLGELPQLVDRTAIQLDGLKRRQRRTYEIAANWKVVVDNYLECYHCPVAHPGFCDLIDVDQYEVSEYECFSTQTAPARSRSKRHPYPIGKGVSDGFYAYLWPNFTINIYPGPGNVSLNLFLPAGVDRTLAVFEYCFVDEVRDEEVESFAAFVDQVQREDTVLCESVQMGLTSGVFDQGRLMLSKERALRHFQKLVYQSIWEAV